MNAFLRGLLFLLAFPVPVVAPVSASAAGAHSVYTSTRQSACKLVAQDGERFLSCSGLGGYQVEILPHGAFMEVDFVQRPGPGDDSDRGIVWRRVGEGIGPRLEWRIQGRTAIAAILRISRLDPPDGRPCPPAIASALRQVDRTCSEGSIGSYLLVIDPRRNCVMAVVKANAADANERARRIADGGGRSCPGDRYTLPLPE